MDSPLPPTLLSFPELLAELKPTGVFTNITPRCVEYWALLNGVKLSKNPDSNHGRAWRRLVAAGGFVGENTDHLPEYTGEVL